MRPSKTISLFALACFALSALAAGSDETQIRAVYGKLAHSMMSKSVAGVKALEGPGFSDTEHGQTMDAAKANSLMDEEFKSVERFTECDIRITSLRVSGKSASVKTTFAMSATFKKDGRRHKFHAYGKTEDHLVKTGRGWLFSTTKDTEEHATMDGKAVQG